MFGYAQWMLLHDLQIFHDLISCISLCLAQFVKRYRGCYIWIEDYFRLALHDWQPGLANCELVYFVIHCTFVLSWKILSLMIFAQLKNLYTKLNKKLTIKAIFSSSDINLQQSCRNVMQKYGQYEQYWVWAFTSIILHRIMETVGKTQVKVSSLCTQFNWLLSDAIPEWQ